VQAVEVAVVKELLPLLVQAALVEVVLVLQLAMQIMEP
jgi:hypothetical protein